MIRSLALSLILASPASAMTLTSTDIQDGKTISAAQIYPRCGGQNISPALSWSGAPPKTESYVLTMIDLDVKPSEWSHWIVVGLPRSVTTLARGAKTLPAGAHGIQSNFGDANYDGPCPPAGSGTHHYKVTIWAMPAPSVAISADTPAKDLAATLQGLALDKASITGSVTR
jgi:Raf kinase inhibitor-like YbhB/YbcL family protein